MSERQSPFPFTFGIKTERSPGPWSESTGIIIRFFLWEDNKPGKIPDCRMFKSGKLRTDQNEVREAGVTRPQALPSA